MTENEKATGNWDPDEGESLVTSFHRVQSLIPREQGLLTIPPEMPVKEALVKMHEHRYSQLPVVAGNAVLGVFSYRSFSAKALARQKTGKAWLGDLPVEDFLEEFEYAHPADDWNRVLRYLNQDDAFLVGHRDGLSGLITTIDVLRYFQDIANPFIMLAEIELSLRKIIQACVEGEDLPEFFRNALKSSYGRRKVPAALRDLTFYDYITLITSQKNWPYFKEFFGDREGVRAQTNQKLDQLRQWRNTVFHFRRRLEQRELNTLAEYRGWLQRRVRAYEGRRRQRKIDSPKRTKGKTTRDLFLDQCSPAAASFFNYVLERSQSAGHFVYWGEKGFSVRVRLPNGIKMATFAYNFPPDAFSFYHAHLPISEDDIISIRQDLLAFNFFEPTGQYSIKTTITEDNLSELYNAYDYILEKMAEIN